MGLRVVVVVVLVVGVIIVIGVLFAENCHFCTSAVVSHTAVH